MAVGMIEDLKGKVALLTGASGTLVSEMAEGLCRSGATVVCADLNKASPLDGGMVLDVTQRWQWINALAGIIEYHGGIDILVNGAGTNASTPFFEITDPEWKYILDVQLTGTFLGCQIIGKHMCDRGSGSIINITSASAYRGLSKAITYSAAKAAVSNLTANLGREFAPHGVRVNALRPGFFPSPEMKEKFLTSQRVDQILGHTPMGRFGRPAELVGAVLWLASEASSFVTGAEIAVDGGFTAMTI